MKAEDLRKEIPLKEKSIKDLSRYIKTRNDDTSNYCLLLGAGCSITSGIQSGEQLITEWRKEMYLSNKENNEGDYSKEDAIQYLTAKHPQWYSPSKEYSSLFERKYDLPRQRRMFVEQQVSNASPSIGYSYLVSLVKKNYLNTIFTTNFDDLINEAFYLFSDLRPLTCAHDSGISSITVTSKRPKLLKLHGDYLFDDIKTTLRETESLELNMKNKFMEFSRDYGLIVVGYSGIDRSIMDTLNALLKNEDYYKSGIYWCLRKDAEIGEELRKILWKERVYYVLIDGFDEMMAQIHDELCSGELPISTLSVTKKPMEIVGRFLNNEYLKSSECKIIARDLDLLGKEAKRDSLFEMFKKIESENEDGNKRFSDSELLFMVTIGNELSNKRYESALEMCRDAIVKDLNKEAKIKVLGQMVSAFVKMGKEDSAKKICDDIIALDPNNPRHYLEKSRLVKKIDEKIEIIELAIVADAFNSRSYHEAGLNYYIKYNSKFGEEKEKYREKALACFDKSLEVFPAIQNESWGLKFKLQINYSFGGKNGVDMAEIVLNEIKKQEEHSPFVLRLEAELLAKKKDKELIKLFLKKINESKDKNYAFKKSSFNFVKYNALIEFDKIDEAYLELDEVEDFSSNDKALFLKGRHLRRYSDDLAQALEFIRMAIEISENDDYIEEYVDCLIDFERYEEAEKKLKQYEDALTKAKFAELLVNIEIGRSSPAKALEVYLKTAKEYDIERDSINAHAYMLIKCGKYSDAKGLLREFLEKINYDLNATAEIVNLELCIKKNGQSVNKERLEKVLACIDNPKEKAAVYALLGRKELAIENIKKATESRKDNKYLMKRWPVLEEYAEYLK